MSSVSPVVSLVVPLLIPRYLLLRILVLRITYLVIQTRHALLSSQARQARETHLRLLRLAVRNILISLNVAGTVGVENACLSGTHVVMPVELVDCSWKDMLQKFLMRL